MGYSLKYNNWKKYFHQIISKNRNYCEINKGAKSTWATRPVQRHHLCNPNPQFKVLRSEMQRKSPQT